MPAATSTTWLRRWCMTARSSHGSARGRRTWSSQTPCLVSSRCSFRDAGRPCVYGSRKSTRIVAGAARRRFAAAITPSLVSGTPPPSIPCGVSFDLTRPSLSRRCASFASRCVRVGPLATVRQCVCVNNPDLFKLHYTMPLQNYAAKGRRRFASLAPARAGVVCGACGCAVCR